MIPFVLPGLPLQPQMLCSNPPRPEDRMSPLYKFVQLISYPTDNFFFHTASCLPIKSSGKRLSITATDILKAGYHIWFLYKHSGHGS